VGKVSVGRKSEQQVVAVEGERKEVNGKVFPLLILLKLRSQEDLHLSIPTIAYLIFRPERRKRRALLSLR
jgi:hypothetical protein